MNKILSIILVVSLMLSGCASLLYSGMRENSSKYYSDGCGGRYFFYKNYEIEIISDPPGAKIEWDGDYIGITPLKHTINGPYNGPDSFIRIVAYPIYDGQQTQVKFTRLNKFLPRKIYFDMDLIKTPKRNDVNLTIKR